MKTDFPNLALIAACTAVMPASAPALAGPVVSVLDVNSRKQDLTPIPPTPPIVALGPTSSASVKERTLGVCVAVGYVTPDKQEDGGVDGLSPTTAAVSYFKRYENQTLTASDYPDTLTDVRVVRAPVHGKVAFEPIAGEKGVFWYYRAEPGYEGKDRVDLLVQVKGQPVRLVYFLHVTRANLDATPSSAFCKQSFWKISAGTSDSGYSDLLAWQVNPTPLDNTDDYLPTSNPNI